MSAPMDRQRTMQLAWTGGAAALAFILALILLVSEAQRDYRPRLAGPVLPDWTDISGDVSEIEIHGPEGRFDIVRRSGLWVMPSRDDHPVRAERIAQFDEFWAGLTHEGARTADPAKHARLNLAETGEAGAGHRIVMRTAAGAVVADFVLGRGIGRRVYLREAGRDQTFAASLGGTTDAIPDIGRAEDWLELDFLALDRSAIAFAEISPETGPAYRLERASRGTRNFALRQPSGWRPITVGAGNGPASALGRLRFRDVRRADRLSGDVVARHRAETFDGLRITLNVVAQGETRWAVIDVEAVTDDQQAQAEALAARVDGWAYLLSDLSLDRLLRPLREIADPREVNRDAP